MDKLRRSVRCNGLRARSCTFAVSLVALAVAACSGSTQTGPGPGDATTDTKTPDATLDAFVPATDSGSDALDAFVPATDSGSDTLDAFVPATDGGSDATLDSPPLADANGDAPASDADAAMGVCTPGSKQCTGTVPETCDASGQWQLGAACPYVCSAGVCSGTCVPGTVECTGSQPQLCGASGTWQNNGAPCVNVCSAGMCAGSCSPGSQECSGLQPETCAANGTWQNAGSPCAYVCTSGQCSGVCVPGAVQCSGTTPQTCDASGAWQSGSACPFVCSAGQCAGSCTPGALQCSGQQPQQCSASGSWQNNGAACPYVCTSGACTGVCAPGATTCGGEQIETCGATGQWGAPQDCSNNQLCTGSTCGCAFTGLEAYFPFNGDTLDYSGNGFNATAQNAGFVAGGVLGEQALAMNGSSSNIGIGTVAGPDYLFTGARTLCGWFKPTASSGLGLPLFAAGSQGAGDFMSVEPLNNPSNGCGSATTLFLDHWGATCNNSQQPMPVNAWSYFCATYYIATPPFPNELDYTLNGSTTQLLSASFYTWDLKSIWIAFNNIGGTTTQPYYPGNVQEVSIWSVALNGGQLAALYSNGLGCKPR